MKIEKHVEAIKVKAKEKVVWVKENRKEVFKWILGIAGTSAGAYFVNKYISEQKEEIERKDQQIYDQQQEIEQKDQIIYDQQQTISEISDEKEMYVESIEILQEEVLELREQVSEDKGIIKKLASDSLRGRRRLGGSMMNSFKNSDSDLDDPQ